jgi:hypothetical protein
MRNNRQYYRKFQREAVNGKEMFCMDIGCTLNNTMIVAELSNLLFIWKTNEIVALEKIYKPKIFLKIFFF